MQRPTARQLGLAAAFLVAVAAWICVLLLLMEVTRIILETLRKIIEIAGMS